MGVSTWMGRLLEEVTAELQREVEELGPANKRQKVLDKN